MRRAVLGIFLRFASAVGRAISMRGVFRMGLVHLGNASERPSDETLCPLALRL